MTSQIGFGIRHPVRHTWEQLDGKPYITVSSKGISNNLSTIPNDGADFGPDTTLGAISPNQIGPPYTQTMGIQEAIYYAISSAPSLLPGMNTQGAYVKLLHGQFIISTKIYLDNPDRTFNGSISLVGSETSDTGNYSQIQVRFSDDYVIEGPAQSSFQNIDLINLAFGSTSSYTQYGVMHWSSANSGNVLYLKSINSGLNLAAGYTPLSISNCQLVILDYYQSYDNPSGSPTNNTIDATNVLASRVYDGLWSISNATYVKWEGAVQETVVFHRVALNNVQIAEVAGVTEVILSGNNGNIIAKNILQGNNIGSAIFNTNVLANTTITLNSLILRDSYIVQRNMFGTYNGVTGTVLNINQMYMRNLVVSNTSSRAFNGNSADVTVNITNFKNEFYTLLTPSYPIESIPYNAPSLSTNPPVSGTVYQNTNPYDIFLSVPITFPVTASTAMTAYLRVGASSTAGDNPILDQFAEPATLATVNGRVWALKARVPVGQYFEVDATNATIDTTVVTTA